VPAAREPFSFPSSIALAAVVGGSRIPFASGGCLVGEGATAYSPGALDDQ